jgi:hypothetical protein
MRMRALGGQWRLRLAAGAVIVADNGSDMYVSGTMDPRWNNDELNPHSAA